MPPVDALRGPCRCEHCRAGISTALHAHESHDHRLSQTFELGAQTVHIVGGTTKCARVFVDYALANPGAFRGRRVLELGSGSGLVAIALAVHFGAHVDATDQAPMLDLLGANIAANTDADRHRITASTLQWGEDLDAWAGRHELVVGCDLNFARENLVALVATLDCVLTSPAQSLILASTTRANWESVLFDTLALAFDRERLVDAGDVFVDRFVRRAGE